MEILGNVRFADGQKCVMISESEWEEFEALRVLFDFIKEQDPASYREGLREIAKELAEEFPEEYQHMIKRNPKAVKYLKVFNARRGRPEALTASQRDFIARNDKLTGKELYEVLRAVYGYTGSLKTIQNELGRSRKLNKAIEL